MCKAKRKFKTRSLNDASLNKNETLFIEPASKNDRPSNLLVNLSMEGGVGGGVGIPQPWSRTQVVKSIRNF